MNILVLDDEVEVADLVEVYLKNENYNVLKCYTPESAIHYIKNETIDLAILDVMVGSISGFEILHDIRESGHTYPVIMLTAKIDDQDKIKGLTLGADDYITKPYNPNILLLRIGAVLKRVNNESNILSYKDLSINIGKGIIKRDDMEIILTKNEMIIFSYLLNHQNKIVTRDELMTDLWNNEEFINDNALTVNISRLRAKLKNIGYEDAIDTRKGMGYILS